MFNRRLRAHLRLLSMLVSSSANEPAQFGSVDLLPLARNPFPLPIKEGSNMGSDGRNVLWHGQNIEQTCRVCKPWRA